MNRPRISRAFLAALGAALLVGTALAAWLHARPEPEFRPTPQQTHAGAPITEVDLPPTAAPVALAVPEEAARPAAVLDIHDGAAARTFLAENEWLAGVKNEPLGRGFAGSWAGFLGTRGEDLMGAFAGTLRDWAAQTLLRSALRLVWFAGGSGTETPALVASDSDRIVQGAVAALDRVARRGTLTADRCPGETKARPGRPMEISRWLVAEHALYGALHGRRLAVARHPGAVLQALCTELPAVTAEKEVAFELSLFADGLGREAQSLTRLLGLGTSVRLQFGLEGGRIVPKGLAGAVARGRLATAALSGDLLKIVPEDTAVVVAARVRLPDKLDGPALRALAEGKAPEGGRERTVVLLWTPRGDESIRSDVGLVWEVADRAFLESVFGPKKRLFQKEVCGHEVLTAGFDHLRRIQAACDGHYVSMADAQPEVSKGMTSPHSLLVAVQTGRLLSQLVSDAWRAEPGTQREGRPMPQEIDDAVRALRDLPFFGLFGTADGERLVPGGFRT